MPDNHPGTLRSRLFMHKYVRLNSLLIILWILAGAWLVWDVSTIPFHPDESTQLFMSRDLEEVFSKPFEMAWQPGQIETPAARYHLLDAPLTRYLIGTARVLAGLAPIPRDWNWAASWEENVAIGALPNQKFLDTARRAITILLPFTLLLMFQIGKQTGGGWTAFLSVVLLGVNGLVLLHARRAMAEGALLFGLTLVLYCLVTQRKPWLLGIAFAIAFNAKQSTAVLLPVCLLAVAWEGGQNKVNYRRVVTGMGIFLLTAAGLTFLLNPFLWKYPLQAAQAAYQARQELLSAQVIDFSRAAPQKVLETPGERAVVLVLETFIAPPSFSEAGNYAIQTRAAEDEYRANPLHNSLRGLIAGTLVLILAVFGGILWMRKIFSSPSPPTQRSFLLVALAFICQFTGLVVTVPLDFQRYAIPLVPFAMLGAAYGLAQILSPLSQRITRPE